MTLLILLAAIWIGLDVALLEATDLSALAFVAIFLQAGCLFAFLHLRAQWLRREIGTQLSGSFQSLGQILSKTPTAEDLATLLGKGCSNLSGRLDGAIGRLEQPSQLNAVTASLVTEKLDTLDSVITRQRPILESCVAKVDAEIPNASLDYHTLLKNLETSLTDISLALQSAVTHLAQQDGRELPNNLMRIAGVLTDAITAQNESLAGCCRSMSDVDISKRNVENVSQLEVSVRRVLDASAAALTALKQSEHPSPATVMDVINAIHRTEQSIGEIIVDGLKPLGDQCADIDLRAFVGGGQTSISDLAQRMNKRASESVFELTNKLNAEKDKLKKEESQREIQTQITYLITHDIPQETKSLEEEMANLQGKIVNIRVLWETAKVAREVLEAGAPAGTDMAVAEYVRIGEIDEAIRSVVHAERNRWPSQYVKQLSAEEFKRWEVHFNEHQFKVILNSLLKNATEHGADVKIVLEIERVDGSEAYAAVSVTNTVPQGEIQTRYAVLKEQITKPIMRKVEGRMRGGTFFLALAAATSMSGSFDCSCTDQTITVRFLTRGRLSAKS